MKKARKKVRAKSARKAAKSGYPIAYWSHSSLMAFLRNPLIWYKRYVLRIYDTPRTPSSVVGTAAHLALEHFYTGIGKEDAIAAGLRYLRDVPDFELNFGVAKTVKAKKEKRASMEREYVQAIGFYLEKPPRHKVVAAEAKSMAKVKGLPLPVKAISDLVVESRAVPGALDIVDHKFVDSFSKTKDKPAFMLQAVFNYHTVSAAYGRPVARFIIIECKKGKNKDGSPQLRRHVLDYKDMAESFELVERLIVDASADLLRERAYLPNPSDMFDGEHSFELYKLRLIESN